ncbi:RluA family pseudouridine synthase [Sulfidibacter corallicola]|uniref:RluA family pseudouridine synthase n=1 Tax=Sulfidibacter corallicola TaxID=2818388 RepID=A0A8A4TCZ3_SULCO|nr:RluA family pseudouridine synthase [Sulfidibacter corallicola]QTD47543.1 RluA family pseudouridine synthase [Sulfidibacter corallicola]
MLNQGQRVVLPLKPTDMNRSLADYVARHAPIFRGHDVCGYLAERRFHVNGEPAPAETILQSGDKLELMRPPWHEPEVPRDFPIVFEDADVLVVDKPAGIPITPTGPFLTHSLLHLLRNEFANPDLAPIHRLDLETSGLIAFAKRVEARGWFQSQFQRQTVEKRYEALVFGRIPKDLHLVDIALDRDTLIHSKFVPHPQGKPARTEILDRHHWGTYSFVSLRPLSGRTHQIRAHLAAVGHPIVGDKKYGSNPGLFLKWLETKDTKLYLNEWKLPAQALHNRGLILQDRKGCRLVLHSERDVAHSWQRGIASIDGDIQIS